uniref:Poly A polymerase head domain-containing protein n=1 Tax=Aureoumbra lagunensis TaxID=44058 RepID=A0A7S3JSV2_9STRA|mmetsp:Transcript_1419/g.1855  ORF Transcript_1419/g.1855 Transcript_1419/m.1855 type:complete len:568 (-) Transcript_1419:1081-2784(-)|eukprot:CAMPEP_0197287390 /NCGR_PEP_ID=MMETSP0890-20130614/3683_1 /TAXON_ID=44058 ORGANISM="Aureoumbra lagunensis, Strain CCMP1510" /NCGR_SAMPLE_ID=MMETSP0890 /ASSEMBLY_ACC=CAM_ASM_000533 /LENGTH=567 /DNA_ID=CAMNT_0042756969 /DNA_START=368 /DNA_END=2071 /DNA_ORIENTATION=+
MTESVESLSDLKDAFVELTSNETSLVDILVQAAKPQGTTVRICGGWVRDKALGRVTKDIDVAVDNCSGAAFAERAKAVLEAREDGKSSSSKIAVIAANPDQSKHLETATMRLYGLDVDFVNLRSEAYADAQSRVPTSVHFGTPLEDALRRDFTVNALFFNVHTKRIEDYTQKGWADLRAGVLRTPLEAKITLLDDPLRALRGVRFAARYGFSLDFSFVQACRDPQVKQALLTKVSRERVGKEIRGAFGASAKGALRALNELVNLNLASATFRAVHAQSCIWNNDIDTTTKESLQTLFDTNDKVISDTTSSIWRHASRCLNAHASLDFVHDPDGAAFRTRGGAQLALGLTLVPLAQATAIATNAKKNAPLPAAICRDGLKLPNNDIDKVHKLTSRAIPLAILVHRVAALYSSDQYDKDQFAELRRDVGNFLFDTKELWIETTAVARAFELATKEELWSDKEHFDLEAARPIIDAYATFLSAVRDSTRLGLDNIWSALIPFFDGNSITEAVGIPKGPAVGVLLQAQRDFQLAHPAASKTACQAFLTNHYITLRDSDQLQAAVQNKKRRH